VEQRERWIADARIYKETWADDSESWFYYNEETGKRSLCCVDSQCSCSVPSWSGISVFLLYAETFQSH
jgi:hypothetical protein